MINVSHTHPYLRFPKKRVSRVIYCVYAGEKKKPLSTISVIFTNNKQIIKINREFLHHSYSTDIITFSFNDDHGNEAELYINLDAAKEQAQNYGVTFWNETQRLIIHGILHLLGYKDSLKAEQKRIHEREDYYLKLLMA